MIFHLNGRKRTIPVLIAALASVLLMTACSAVQPVMNSDLTVLETKDTLSKPVQSGYNRHALSLFIDGVIAEMTGDAFEAVISYESARRLDTASETIYSTLAGLYIDIGELDKAERALNQLIIRNPGNTSVLGSLADLCLQKRDYSRAIDLWEKVCRIDPLNVESRYKLIALYELQGKWTEMARHYEFILRDHQDNIILSAKLGALYLKMKEYNRAVTVYEQALQFDPNNLYLLEALASTHLIKKDYKAALGVYDIIARLKPSDRIVNHRIASLALQLGEYEKSLKHFRMIESAADNQFDVHRGIGFSLYQLKQPAEAVPYLEKAAQLNDKDVLSMSLLSGIFQDRKDFEKSDYYFEKILRLEPDNDLILNNYSYSLADRGVQLDKALTMIRRAMEKSQENPHYLDTHGWVLYQMKQYDQASRYIKRSYDLDSSSWEVTMHMGDVHEKLVQPGKALYYFERALTMNGNADILKPKIEKLRKETRNDK